MSYMQRSKIERARGHCRPVPLGSSPEDHFGGILGGKIPPAKACRGHCQLASASAEPVQSLYGGYRNRLVVHGKEKVYGFDSVRGLSRSGGTLRRCIR
jgi:hypothetical protein